LVTTEEECKLAATGLNIPYHSSGHWRMDSDFKGCFKDATDGKNMVFFNTAFDDSFDTFSSWNTDSMNQNYHAICRKIGRNISAIGP